MNIDIHSDRQPTPNLWTGGRGVIGAIVACTVAAAVGLLPGVGQSRKSSVPDAPAAAAPAVPAPPTVASVSEPAAPPRAATARVAPPVQFSLNLGQSSGEVRYLARGSRLSAEVFDDGIGITGTPQRGAGVALAGTSHAHAAQPARVR